MASLKDLTGVWNNIKEVDLKPIRDSATHPVRIVLAGEPGSGRHTLAEQMRSDPARPGIHTQSSVILLSVDPAEPPPSAHLTIVLVNSTREDVSKEQGLVQKWTEAGKNVLVVINTHEPAPANTTILQGLDWKTDKILLGPVTDSAFLLHEFVPLVLELLPQQHLALGRQFPLFRIPIARQLINDTCLSNAAYSFSTGLAEIVPVLDLPLNLTDMIVLTKSQAFLAFKLGLLVGFSTRWQDYVKEFGGIIGGGFLWRQIARQLVGLIPLWGIIPKVVIAYSGTYVVGHAVLGWYLNGRQLSAKQMRDLSKQAMLQGKEYAKRIGNKLPHIRLPRRKRAELPAHQSLPVISDAEIMVSKEGDQELLISAEASAVEMIPDSPNEMVPDTTRQGVRAGKLNPRRRTRHSSGTKDESRPLSTHQICSQCGKSSAADARFCQYCGHQFEP